MDIGKHVLNIIHHFPEPVITIKSDSTIVYVNNAYCSHFSVDPQKIIGRKLNELEPRAHFLEVLKTGKPLINDYSYVESLKMDVLANIVPIYENGSVIGAFCMMKNINEVQMIHEELKRYKSYTVQLEEKLDETLFASLKTHSSKMKKAVEVARKIANSDVTVLIHGETGVGKEIFAKAIHNASPRKDMPFVPINMASLPEALFESELFGYEEGSFTGSRKGGKNGLFVLANKGTLFLDEIGELPLPAQAKLLRVIQERVYRKVGGTMQHPLDVRLIAATNRNLLEEIRGKRFREDLYYRLNVVPIHIPPLRERKEDLSFLVNNILGDLATKYRKNVTLSPEVLKLFETYDWPGNVRELVNVLERIMIVSTHTYVELDDIPELTFYAPEAMEHDPSLPLPLPLLAETANNKLNSMLQLAEKEMIEKVLKESKNKTEAILKLGISRKSFYAKLNKYDLL